MAYTERYVSSTGTDTYANSTSSGTPMSLATAFANAVAGDRINIISDGVYSLGATSWANQGTISQYIMYRGYNSTIGDLDEQGRNADGTLNVTNFPEITLTGILQGTVGNVDYHGFMNLNFSGAINSGLIGNNSQPDHVMMYQCKVVNTFSGTEARTVYMDNNNFFINCDFECTGASHNRVVDVDYTLRMIFCRVKATDATNPVLAIRTDSQIIGNIIIGAGGSPTTGHAIEITSTANGSHLFMNNTAYNCGTFLETANFVATDPYILINNHVTDCVEFIDNLYQPTADLAYMEFFNRTRDITTMRTGVGDSILVGEITTDTGGAETDFVDAANDDFRLISNAPGKDSGLGL